MTTLAISIDEDMQDHLREQAAAKGFATAEEYAKSVLQEDLRRQEMERLEDLMIEGQNSGDPIEVTPEFWEDIRKSVRDELAKDRPQ